MPPPDTIWTPPMPLACTLAWAGIKRLPDATDTVGAMLRVKVFVVVFTEVMKVPVGVTTGWELLLPLAPYTKEMPAPSTTWPMPSPSDAIVLGAVRVTVVLPAV